MVLGILSSHFVEQGRAGRLTLIVLCLSVFRISFSRYHVLVILRFCWILLLSVVGGFPRGFCFCDANVFLCVSSVAA